MKTRIGNRLNIYGAGYRAKSRREFHKIELALRALAISQAPPLAELLEVRFLSDDGTIDIRLPRSPA